MSNYLGILFALVALLSWGFGDFLIQKTTRVVGVWKALFFIGITGLIVLFPFVYSEIFNLEQSSWLLLVLLGIVVIFAALFNFKALKQGKIAVVEPLLGLELPITVGLSISLGREQLTPTQLAVIAIVFVGIVLSITVRRTHLERSIEKGVIWAGIGAIGMALTNFLVGVSSQQISPLMTIWFTHSLIAVVCATYLTYKGEFKTVWSDLKTSPGLIAGQSILANSAWVAFGFATTLIPISIATTISESYIALAVFLGIFINKEKLRPHQMIGVVLAVGGVVALSALTK